MSGDLLGAAEIFKMVRYAATEGRDKNGGGEKFEEVRG
jgi:hypothetical protein